MSARRVIDALEQFRWAGGSWLDLDRLVEELWRSGTPEEGMTALLGIFERYPEQDGGGVFWSILHGLESLDGYESALIASLRRAPSLFGVMMMGRILNTDLEPARATEARALLEEVARNERASEAVREEASGWLKQA